MRDFDSERDTETFTFADSLMIKFIAARSGQVASAAERFLHYRKLVIEHRLTFVVDDDVRAAAALGFMHTFPPSPATKNHPLVVVLPRQMNWKKVSVLQAKKLWFVMAIKASSMSVDAQRKGIAVTNSMEGTGFGNFCMEFQVFLLSAVHQCMPMRIAVAFIANQPFLFGSVIFPLMQKMLPKKIQSRIIVIGKKYEKAAAYFGSGEMLLPEIGGCMSFDLDAMTRRSLACLDEQ